MISLYAFGFIDNPWVILIILLVTALSSWLSKRRESQDVERETPPTPEGKRPKEFDLEEAMRRLLGEEPTPKSAPVPPPIPRASNPPDWQEESPVHPPPIRRPAPPPPVPAAFVRPDLVPAASVEEEIEGGPGLMRLTPSESRPPSPGYGPRDRSRGRRATSYAWGDRRSAREAFVASLVFGPPKGLEP